MKQTRSLGSPPRTRNQLHVTLRVLAPAALLLLAACTGPKAQSPDPAAVSKVGRVVITEIASDTELTLTATASFSDRSEAVPSETITSKPFGQALGTCDIAVLMAAVPSPAGSVPASNNISAGSEISLRQGSDDLAQLTWKAVDRRYHSADPAGSLGAANLTVAVPGNSQFKSFKVTVPLADPLVVTPDTSVNADTEFRWTAAGSDFAVLLVGANDLASFSCLVPDTGSFAFSSEDQSQLTAAGFSSGSLATAGRLSLTTTAEGDSLLLVSVVRLNAIDAGKTE